MARPHSIENLTDHVVICNCNAKVGKIVEELHTGTLFEPPDVVLLIQDEELWRSHPEWHPPASAGDRFYTVEGCPTDKNDLRKVSIKHTRAAVILADPNHGDLADAPSTLTAMAIEKQNPQVHTVIELIASSNRRLMEATDVNEIICMREISEKLIVQSSLNPGIKNIFEDLLTVRQGTSQLYTITVPSHLTQLTYRQLAEKIILADVPFILIGFVTTNHTNESENGADDEAAPRSFLSSHQDTGELHSVFSQIVINPKVDLNPGKDTVLSSQDRLVIIGHEHPDFQDV
ncbi:hypothetical protein QUF90_26730 [Desulfococcaceae bacterium HSG9]|nr:hypothetical protein [Desulfococcaceae bacterium HSG9]